MTILDTIITHKRKEVQKRRELYPVKLLEQSIYFSTAPVSFSEYLKRDDKVGIIAEIKRKSPSKGILHPFVSVEQLSIGYMQAGASALSVLTDHEFFGGSNEDLSTARKYNFCPILRKDFIIDEYQIVEARSIGADVILLIASALSPEEIKHLSRRAKELDLEVLLEVHSKEELERSLTDTIDVVGVNNRDLTDFSVSLDTSLSIVDNIPSHLMKISESGLQSAEDIVTLKNAGFSGFLIGERFMSTSQPEQACARLIRDVLALEAQAAA